MIKWKKYVRSQFCYVDTNSFTAYIRTNDFIRQKSLYRVKKW